MKFISAAIALLAATRLSAVEIPAGGLEMSASAELSAYADGMVGTTGKIDPTGYRLSITQPDPANIFRAQVSIACPQGALAKGDKVLAMVTARVVGQENSSVEAKLQLAGPPHTQATNPTGIGLSQAWTEYPLLFVVEHPIPEGKASMNLFCANAAQVIEVSAIRVFRYAPDTDVSNFPRVRRSCAGREPDAPWRTAALERIEKIRKADCSLVLTSPDGRPLANTRVQLTLRRHEFGFGSAVPANLLVADTEDARRFREIVDRLFSIVVFEDDLKDMWGGDSTPPEERTARNAGLNKAFDHHHPSTTMKYLTAALLALICNVSASALEFKNGQAVPGAEVKPWFSRSYPTAHGTPIGRLAWGVATRSVDDTREFLHVLNAPDGKQLKLPPPADGKQFAASRLLPGGAPVAIEQTDMAAGPRSHAVGVDLNGLEPGWHELRGVMSGGPYVQIDSFSVYHHDDVDWQPGATPGRKAFRDDVHLTRTTRELAILEVFGEDFDVLAPGFGVLGTGQYWINDQPVHLANHYRDHQQASMVTFRASDVVPLAPGRHKLRVVLHRGHQLVLDAVRVYRRAGTSPEFTEKNTNPTSR